MKQLRVMLFLALFLFLPVLPAYAEPDEAPANLGDAGAFHDAEEETLTVVYCDEKIPCENAAICSGDVTYLPLREVLNAYGLDVSWAVGEAEDKVILSAGSDRFQLLVDLDACEAYGSDKRVYTLKHEDSILYLPVSFYTDVVNCKTSWDVEASVLTLNDSAKKKEAAIFNPSNGGISYHKLINLPAYVRTAAPAPVVSRSSGSSYRQNDAHASSGGTIFERGVASYYGAKFHGRRTSSGEAYDKNAYTAAHKTLPFGTRVRVTALWNQKSVIVRINDRGPYTHGRVIDLSTAAARDLGMLSKGLGQVTLEVVSYP